MSDELGDFSMLDLFRLEVDNQATILSDGLLVLEQDAQNAGQLEALMRAAHSIKGAARMVDVSPGVDLAHAMEDCFVAAQKGELVLQATQIDLLLKGVDQLVAISKQEADSEGLPALCEKIRCIDQLESVPDPVTQGTNEETGSTATDNDPAPAPEASTNVSYRDEAPTSAKPAQPAANEEAVRVSSENLSAWWDWPARCKLNHAGYTRLPNPFCR